MPPGKSFRARGAAAAVPALACGLALTLSWALGAAPALAMARRPGNGVLSPRLAELAKPSVRSLSLGRQAKLLSLARSGPGSLLRHGDRLVVEARFEGGLAGKAGALRAAGANVVNVSGRYRTVTAAVKPADLRALAAIPGVAGVKEVLTPIIFASSTCPAGTAVSEGDTQLRAAEARSDFGVNGSGVTVGILSDSFNKATQAADGSGPVATHAEEDVESGDLPGAKNTCTGEQTPVNVLEDFSPAGPGEEALDEGRAMSQIVHDLAPGANLAFATAFSGEAAFAGNIKRLAKPVSEGGAGARVIADDVAYFEEPFFQDGPVADAIREVTSKGVAYFTAAGNDNLIEKGSGNEIASWEAAAFRNSGSCPAALAAKVGAANAASCMDFNPGPETDNTFGITVEKGATLMVDLQWAEPWYGVTTDLDAFLLNSKGEPIVAGGSMVGSTEDNVSGSHRPVEFFQWENTTGESQQVQLAVNRCSGSCNPAAGATATPRLKLILLENGGGVSSTEYPTSVGGDIAGPAIFGHAGAASAVSVGAVPFYTNSEPERYSSRGPATHYFGPVNGTTPAAPLTTPETVSKPDIAATDCGATTFFAQFGTFPTEESPAWHFCGTSAAAPHAAAVAALLLQKEPKATPEAIRSALWASAAPVGKFGPCAVGAGLIDAVGAVQHLGSTEPVTAPECKPPVSSPWTVIETGGTVPPPIPVEGSSTPNPLAAPQSEPLPRAFFLRHPPKLIRTHRRRVRVEFEFGSSRPGATLLCRVDAGPFRPCSSRLVRRFKLGRHVVRVEARNAAGNVSQTPAVFRFRVKRIR